MSQPNVPVLNWSALPSDYAERYECLDNNYSHLYTRAAERLAGLSGIKVGDSVVDVGAGTGISTEVIARMVGSGGRILAIDPSELMLRRAARKKSLRDVTFVRGGAEDLAVIATDTGLIGSADVVLSSFTYYYTFQCRAHFYASVQRVLRPGGRLVFNLTRYLGEIKIGDKFYNSYSEIYLSHLIAVLQRRGIESRMQSDETSEQFRDTAWEASQLRSAGFEEVQTEAWPLPIRPSEAYRFTLDGFYSQGSRVTFSPGLMDMPTKERVDVLKEALADCANVMDVGEGPYVANIVATKKIEP